MSSYYKNTKHPNTGRWSVALWMDDHFGDHHYGVKFANGDIFDPNDIKLETNEDPTGKVFKQPRLIEPKKKKLSFKGLRRINFPLALPPDIAASIRQELEKLEKHYDLPKHRTFGFEHVQHSNRKKSYNITQIYLEK